MTERITPGRILVALYVLLILCVAYWLVPTVPKHFLAIRTLGVNTRLANALLVAPKNASTEELAQLMHERSKLEGKYLTQNVDKGHDIELDKLADWPELKAGGLVPLEIETPDWLLLNQGTIVEVWAGGKLKAKDVQVAAIVPSGQKWLALLRKDKFGTDDLGPPADKPSLRIQMLPAVSPVAPVASLPKHFAAIRTLGANTRIASALLVPPKDASAEELAQLMREKSDLEGKYLAQNIDKGHDIELDKLVDWPDVKADGLVPLEIETPDWLLLNQGTIVEVWAGGKLKAKDVQVAAIVPSGQKWLALLRKDKFGTDDLGPPDDKPSLRIPVPPAPPAPPAPSVSPAPPVPPVSTLPKHFAAIRALDANTRIASALLVAPKDASMDELAQLMREKSKLEGKYLTQKVDKGNDIELGKLADWPELTADGLVPLEIDTPDWLLLNQGTIVEVWAGGKRKAKGVQVAAILPSGTKWLALLKKDKFIIDDLGPPAGKASLRIQTLPGMATASPGTVPVPVPKRRAAGKNSRGKAH
jgi:hypothetical protein